MVRIQLRSKVASLILKWNRDAGWVPYGGFWLDSLSWLDDQVDSESLLVGLGHVILGDPSEMITSVVEAGELLISKLELSWISHREHAPVTRPVDTGYALQRAGTRRAARKLFVPWISLGFSVPSVAVSGVLAWQGQDWRAYRAYPIGARPLPCLPCHLITIATTLGMHIFHFIFWSLF